MDSDESIESIMLCILILRTLCLCRKNQDLQLEWRHSIRESRNENDRLLSLLELVCFTLVDELAITAQSHQLTEKIRSELHDNLGAKKAALKQFKVCTCITRNSWALCYS